jgi:arylsulfatase A-like enzyme
MMHGLKNTLTGTKILVFILVICCSCSKSRPHIKKPRLVILYAVCTVNKDFLSPYNGRVSYTPNIERFSRKSVVFTKHITETGQSGPSYASIFSGTQAYRHGVYRHPTMLPDDLYLISEAYNDNAYETFFWNGHKMASAALNYGQGVTWKNTFDYGLSSNSPEFLGILKRLKTDKNYQAFVMTNFTVTHAPYDPRNLEIFVKKYPEEAKDITAEDIYRYERLYRDNYLELQWNFPETAERLNLSQKDITKLSQVVELLYKKNIMLLDMLFGKVVEEVEKFGLLDESLIVFTADHGEILYRENALFKWTHGAQLAPEVLTVPLIIYSSEPRIKPGNYEKVTRSIDVFPTMMGLSGLSLPRKAKIEGTDLSMAMVGVDSAPELRSYSHTCVLNQYVLEQMKDWTLLYTIKPRVDVNLIWVSIRENDMTYKLTSPDAKTWDITAYDLRNDPMETLNRYAAGSNTDEEMAKALKSYKERLVKSYNHYVHSKSKERVQAVPRDDQIEALKSLGYIK